MIRLGILKIVRFFSRIQRREEEHYVIHRLNGIRLRDPQNALLDPKYLPPIKIENGKLNEEGQMVLANVLAEYLRNKAGFEKSAISYGIYLEKSKKIIQQLTLKDLKILGLLNRPAGPESPLIPENYHSRWSSIHIVDD